MGISQNFQTHLDSGTTTLARCWQIARRDGMVLGFTDHDLDLSFAGTLFRAGTGLTAQTLEQATGLSVDNSEAIGALSDAAITETDIAAGRFDGAQVTTWMVNWADVAQRVVLFRGTLGDISRSGGAFRAELRGLSEPLNQPQGRVFQRACSAVLGDSACGVDLSIAGYEVEAEVLAVQDNRVLTFAPFEQEEGWFEKGRLRVLSGAAEGLEGLIKTDTRTSDHREIGLWAPLAVDVQIGDRLRLQVGCDKRFDTCRLRFANHLNFRGFPDIAGEDWLAVGPRDDGSNTGGSLRR